MGAYLAVYGASVLAAWMVGASKKRAGAGFVLGLLLSWLGVALALFLSPTPSSEGRRPCPFCAESILPAARLCPHCGTRFATLPLPPAGTAESWMQDPSGRHPLRWWNGTEWTHWVADKRGGTRSEDLPVAATGI